MTLDLSDCTAVFDPDMDRGGVYEKNSIHIAEF